MRGNFRRTPSGRDSVTLSSQPQNYRPHRHKKFHVRPEALGEGYETYDVLTQSSSPPPTDSPAANSIQEVEAIVANASTQSVATALSEWEKVSDKETGFRTARNGLRFWFWGFTLLIMLMLFCGYRGWFWRVVDWMHQFPLPTR
jgi:hypothetical protein